MNKVILMGRLTRDVEMRQTPNGVSLARFSIAVNRRFAGKDAQQQADFINFNLPQFYELYQHQGEWLVRPYSSEVTAVPARELWQST